MSQIITRLATLADAAFLKEMNDRFNGPGVTVESVQKSLQTNQNEVVAIVECDQIPVGFCCAQITHSICSMEPAAEITELYILNSSRRKGCAGQLVTFVEEICRNAYGVENLRLLTGSENYPAQRLYEGLGYGKEDEILYVK